MRKQLLGGVLVALFLLVGCDAPKKFGGVSRLKIYRNIVSLSPSTSEFVSMLGAPIVGRTKSCNWPDTIGNAEVVADPKPNYEKIVALHPNLIVFDKDLYNEAEKAKMKQTGAETMEIGGDTVKDFIKEMYVAAEKISGEGAVMEYVNKIQRQQKSSEGEPPATPVRTVLILPDSSGHHMIAGVKSFSADLVRIMGGTMIGPDSNKFEMLSPEFLIKENPDLIVVAGKSKDFNDPRFAGLNAVKNLKMFGINQDLILRRGSRIDDCIYQGHKAFSLVTKGKS